MSNNFTYFEREKLEYLLRSKQSLRRIAKVMRRNVSIISREIRRNGFGRKTYRADVAQRKYEQRKHEQHVGKLDKHPELREYVESRLQEDWSPEQIAGRLSESPPAELAGLKISHESIYFWIFEKSEKHKKLHKHLRTRRDKRRRQGKRKHKKTAIPGKISIHARPETVDAKVRIGDWESDTVEFTRTQKNPYLSVQYERKSQLVRIHKVPTKHAEETLNALYQTIESLPQDLFHTMTFDNGSEGAKHQELTDAYGIETYFCDPYCSWQKGGVENMNKLLRQYLPRKTDMNVVSDEHLHTIQEKLNNRPRKSLNYLTPNEFIHKSVAPKT